MLKILVVIWNAFDERVSLLNEDMEVRNASSKLSSLGNRIYHSLYQIDTIKFICNHFRDVPALRNLNVIEAED